MPTPGQLFFTMLLPAICSAGIFAASVFVTARDDKKSNLQWIIAAAIGIGYLIGYIGIEKKFTLVPVENIQWFFYLTVFAILSSTYWDYNGWRRIVSQIIYSILIPRILLNPYFQHHWETFEGIIWWVCLSIGIFVLWSAVKQSFSTMPSSKASLPFIYFGISGGTAVVIALSGSLRLALHAGTLVAIFAAIWITTVVLQSRLKTGSKTDWQIFHISTSPLMTFLLVGIWLIGYFYAEAPSISILLLAISPFMAQVGKINAIRELEGKKSIIVQVGLIALCVSIAMVIALVRSGLFSQDTYNYQ